MFFQKLELQLMMLSERIFLILIGAHSCPTDTHRWSCSVMLSDAQWCSLLLNGARWCSFSKLALNETRRRSRIQSDAPWYLVIPSDTEWSLLILSSTRIAHWYRAIRKLILSVRISQRRSVVPTHWWSLILSGTCDAHRLPCLWLCYWHCWSSPGWWEPRAHPVPNPSLRFCQFWLFLLSSSKFAFCFSIKLLMNSWKIFLPFRCTTCSG